MRREIKFTSGYNCIDFPCRFEKKCSKDNSHGRHGMTITFLLHGELGAIQFALQTGWMPFHQESNKIAFREIPKNDLSALYPMPTDLGYHSYKAHYEGHSSMGKCSVLND